MVGTLEPRKNQACVLDAFDAVRAAVPDVHLVVVGRAGWDAGAVLDRLGVAAAGPRVHWFPAWATTCWTSSTATQNWCWSRRCRRAMASRWPRRWAAGCPW